MDRAGKRGEEEGRELTPELSERHFGKQHPLSHREMLRLQRRRGGMLL